MIRKIFNILLMIFVLFTVFSYEAQAQTINNATLQSQKAIGQTWLCLEAEKVARHTVEIKTAPDCQFFPPGSDVYLVECFSTSDGRGGTCSTGRSAVDGFLGLNGPPPGYTIEHNINQPLKSDLNGKLIGEPFIWKSDGPKAYHSFRGIMLITEEMVKDTSKALKLGSWTPLNSGSECSTTKWDPEGIIFDSSSLEPIDGIEVFLSDGSGNLVSELGIPNPYITDSSGSYTFYVGEGYYSLEPDFSSKFPSLSYTFPSVKDPLPFQSSSDFPYDNIYKGGVFFEPEGEVQVKNIPVDPPAGFSYTRDVKIIHWAQELIKKTGQIKIYGGVTHPKARIFVKNGSIIAKETTSDQFGNFEIYFDSQSVDPQFPISLTVEKSELMKAINKVSFTIDWLDQLKQKIFSLLAPNTFAQINSDQVMVDPILNYLEGFAYDNNGKVLPNATIETYLTFSTKPYSLTKADETGFFRFFSEQLPSLPYKIKIISEQGEESYMTTRNFTAMNKEYMEKNNINYGEYIESEETKSLNGKADQGKNDNRKTNEPDSAMEESSDMKPNTYTWLFVVSLIIILVIVIALVVRKRSVRINENRL